MKALLQPNARNSGSAFGMASANAYWRIMPGGPKIGASSHPDGSLPGNDLESHRSMLERFVRRRVRCSQDAEDIVQNVFLRALAKLDSFRRECPLSQWMLRIAINELNLYYTRVLPKRLGQVPIDSAPEAFEMPDVRSDAGTSNADRILGAARTACSADEARVLELVYRGETMDRIAILLEMHASTVRSQFMRGRGKLLAYLYIHDPDLLGGSQAISESVLKAMADKSTSLTKQEAESLRNPARRMKHLRSACLKIARFLPTPAVILAVIGVLNGTY